MPSNSRSKRILRLYFRRWHALSEGIEPLGQGQRLPPVPLTVALEIGTSIDTKVIASALDKFWSSHWPPWCDARGRHQR